MAAVIVGTFEAENQAAKAVRKLLRSCVPSAHVRTLAPAFRRSGGVSVRRVRVPERRANARMSERRKDARGPDRRTDVQVSTERAGGILVTVKAADNVSQCLAVKVLREHGARNIEQTTAAQSAPAKKSRSGSPSVQYPLPL